MTQKNYRLIFVFVILAFIFNGCDSYYKNMPFASIPPQTISGPIEIPSDWIEIAPPQPLKPLASYNWVNLGFLEYSKGSFSDRETEDSLNLADGRKTKIEAFLFDEQGESYELHLSGVGGGVMLTRKKKVELVNGNPVDTPLDLPTDRNYVRLKIRSEIPLKCSKIEWIGSKPK